MKKNYTFILLILFTTSLSACQKDKEAEIEYLKSDASAYTATLQREDKVFSDFNADGEEDSIWLEYVNIEGSQYIGRFEVQMSGCENAFVLEQYDADFKKMELLDFDGDGAEELLFLFDTHGAGGQGTHDIFVLWIDGTEVEAQLLQPDFEPAVNIKHEYHVDGVYDVKLVSYNGEKKLLTYQYVWGKDGHADGQGTLVSVVSLDKESGSFVADESWLQSE